MENKIGHTRIRSRSDLFHFFEIYLCRQKVRHYNDTKTLGHTVPITRGTSGFAVLRYLVSFLCGIAVLRAKIGGVAVLSFYSAVCGIVVNQHVKFMKYHFPDKEPIIFKTNSWRKGNQRRMGISFCLSPPAHPGNRHPAEERNLFFI